MLSEERLKSLWAQAWAGHSKGVPYLEERDGVFARLIEAAVLRDLARTLKHDGIAGYPERMRNRAARCAKAAKEASRG